MKHTLAALICLRTMSFASEAIAACLSGDTISQPGTYELCTDRINQPLYILTDDVVLDCTINSRKGKVWSTQGGGLSEPQDGRHGINVNFNPTRWLSNIEIRNCDIQGWNSGIQGQYLSGIRLYQNAASGNWDGIDINQSQYLHIKGGSVSNNGGWANSTETCSGNGTTENNVLNGDGLDLDLVNVATIEFVDIKGNFDKGITVNNFRQGCAAKKGCRYNGVDYFNNSILIRNNTIKDNGRTFWTDAATCSSGTFSGGLCKIGKGINLKSAQTCTVTGNTLANNTEAEIDFDKNKFCNSSNVIKDNSINGVWTP
jgi:hypothetical protein